MTTKQKIRAEAISLGGPARPEVEEERGGVPVSQEATAKLSCNIPKSAHKILRMAAAERETTITDLVLEGLVATGVLPRQKL